MRDFLQTHLQEPETFFGSWGTRFLRDTSHHFETPTWNVYQEVNKQKWYQKGLLIALLEELRKEYLQVSLQADSALMRRHEITPQEPWRLRWLQERDVERSAPTHPRHTHCTSRQLSTTANQRHDVPRDWLQNPCQMARVRWGARWEGFCSKEGPHYHIKWSARDQLERNQVQRALVKSSRSCRQTSNNQPWFTTWEIPWGFLAWAALHWLSVGLCHARKCQFKDFFCEKKRYETQAPNGGLHEKPSAKGGRDTGTYSSTRFLQASCFKKMCHVCQEYGGASCMMWYSENQRGKKWMGCEIGFPHSREGCEETSK